MLSVKKIFVAASLCMLAVLCSSGPAVSAWPERPIQFIVPYAPGGGADVAARIFTAQLSKELGVPVVVVNIPGVSGTLGVNQVVEAKPDGYTIAAFHEAPQALFVSGISKYSLAALDILCNLYTYQNIVVIKNETPWKDLSALIAAAKQKNGEVKAGTVLGSPSHFFLLDLMDVADVQVKLIPYNGHAERVNATLGGFVDFTEAPPAAVNSMMRAKKLRPLALLSEKRDQQYPDIPTAKEQGISVIYVSNYALCVPKGTPADVAQKLEAAAKKTTENPDVIKKLQDAGSPAAFIPREVISKVFDENLARYQELAQKNNLVTKKQ